MKERQFNDERPNANNVPPAKARPRLEPPPKKFQSPRQWLEQEDDDVDYDYKKFLYGDDEEEDIDEEE